MNTAAEYHISKGLKKKGPYSLFELEKMKIKPKTLVWKQSNDEWKRAKDIEELEPLFSYVPSSRIGFIKLKKNNFIISLLFAFFGALVSCIIAGHDGFAAIKYKWDNQYELSRPDKNYRLDSDIRRNFSGYVIYHQSVFNGTIDQTEIDVDATLDNAVNSMILPALLFFISTFIIVFVILCYQWDVFFKNLFTIVTS